MTDDLELRRLLKRQMVELDEEGVLTTVRRCLEAGIDPVEILRVCERSMRVVGRRYESGVFYLSGLIMAGEIFRQVLALTRPALEGSLGGSASGRILIGTAQGDIHDIGKTIVHIALRCFGFTVEDLGVNVAPEAFVERALTWRPDVIGISVLISSAFEATRQTVQLLRSRVPYVPVIVGGSLINEKVCAYVGADYWTGDAFKGVRICRRIVRRTREAAGGHRSGEG